jgi:hypothetical protein
MALQLSYGPSIGSGKGSLLLGCGGESLSSVAVSAVWVGDMVEEGSLGEGAAAALGRSFFGLGGPSFESGRPLPEATCSGDEREMVVREVFRISSSDSMVVGSSGMVWVGLDTLHA